MVDDGQDAEDPQAGTDLHAGDVPGAARETGSPLASGAVTTAPGPVPQRLGRWATLAVVLVIVAIFVVLILSAMR